MLKRRHKFQTKLCIGKMFQTRQTSKSNGKVTIGTASNQIPFAYTMDSTLIYQWLQKSMVCKEDVGH